MIQFPRGGTVIPQPFEYHVPKTLAEASRLIAKFGADGKVLAGGHSLVPTMKLRLAAPKHLIDIGRIKELSYVRPDGDGKVEIGALTTHFQIESSELLKAKCPLLPDAASDIADVEVAACVLLAEDGTVTQVGVGIAGVGAKAYRATAVEEALKGKSPGSKRLEEAASHAADGVQANADLYASAEYRAHLARVYTRRALEKAVERASGK